jgi:hypothetical protein
MFPRMQRRVNIAERGADTFRAARVNLPDPFEDERFGQRKVNLKFGAQVVEKTLAARV